MEGLPFILKRLPALPEAVRQVIASFDDPRLDIHALAGKISRDIDLSARVLRVANSPFYGLARQVSSIHEAVVVLGFGNVRGMALAAGIAGVFPGNGDFPWTSYWQRCMAAGMYARSLARCVGTNPESAFTAALFHDIGLAALAHGMPGSFAQAQAEGGDALDAERALLGFDHAELGGEIARYWNFPPAIERAIRENLRAEPSEEPLVQLVRAARLLTEAGMAGVAPVLPEPLLAVLGLDAERMRQCLPQWDDVAATSAALLG